MQIACQKCYKWRSGILIVNIRSEMMLSDIRVTVWNFEDSLPREFKLRSRCLRSWPRLFSRRLLKLGVRTLRLAKSTSGRDVCSRCPVNYVKNQTIYGFFRDNGRESAWPREVTNRQISTGWCSLGQCNIARLSRVLRPTASGTQRRRAESRGLDDRREIYRACTFLCEPSLFGQWRRPPRRALLNHESKVCSIFLRPNSEARWIIFNMRLRT